MTILLSRSNLRTFARATVAHGRRLQAELGLAQPRPPVGIVVEKANWAIHWWGTFTAQAANELQPNIAHVTTDPASLTSGIVEFGSQYQWMGWGQHLSPRCRFVTTFFHGKPEDGPEVARHVDAFIASAPRLDRIVASASIVRERLISWGIAPEKIVHIPIGVETNRFVPPSPEEKLAARARFGIADHEIVVGSFQKDGNGWGEGLEPKLIKGPDIFLAAVEKLAKDLPIFVLLSGPARGYVKQGLERLGVRYAHDYAPDRDALARLYHALDLYLMTSREEGGPMAVMESMSSHVPVVATRVGMAPDLIADGISGALVEVEDVNAIVRRAIEIIDDRANGEAIRKAARNAVMAADWSVVGQRHLDEVWRPLLAEGI